MIHVHRNNKIKLCISNVVNGMFKYSTYKMKLFIAGCILIIAYFVQGRNQYGCSFSVHRENTKKSPVLLQNETTLIVPIKGQVRLAKYKRIKLLCPGSQNFLNGFRFGSNLYTARCIQGNLIDLDGRTERVNFNSLKCYTDSKSDMLKTNTSCGNNQGYIYEIGYSLHRNHLVSLIHVCYDSNKEITIYTEHLLHGEDIRFASNTESYSNFNIPGSSRSVASAYKRSSQTMRFRRLGLTTEYINRSSYLARGHLSPVADFLFLSTQHASYYYINAVPQWQTINNANWKIVENMVRSVAEIRNETLTVYTGTYGVLTLPDPKRREVEIYLLDEKKLPVPKFIWKIIYSNSSQEAIVLVILNNPFFKRRAIANNYLCNNICEDAKWNSTAWDNYQHGFIQCCDYRQFMNVVRTVPKLSVRRILRGSD